MIKLERKDTVVMHTMHLQEIIRKLDEDSPDLDFLQEAVKLLAQEVMEAEVSAHIGAELGEVAPERRTTHRNGYRSRRWDTTVGSIDLDIPKVRSGKSYFPSLLEPRRRVDKALASVVMQCYVEGVSTRKVEDIAEAMGIETMSASTVSRICSDLDELVAEWRTRPLDNDPYPFMWVDAIELKVREGGRVVGVSALIATAVNNDGYREILGVKLGSAETGASWTSFLRELKSRGLSGVRLVTSDAHEGLVDAISSVLDGAAWQRCRTHFVDNLLVEVPQHAQGVVKEAVKSIFEQSRREDAWAQLDRVVEQLEESFPAAADKLAGAAEDILAYTAYPKGTWRRIWSNNPQERLNREIRRRTDVVGIFPDRPSLLRLVGAVLAEQDDEWQIGRRYMNQTLVNKSLMNLVEDDDDQPKELAEQLRSVSKKAG